MSPEQPCVGMTEVVNASQVDLLVSGQKQGLCSWVEPQKEGCWAAAAEVPQAAAAAGLEGQQALGLPADVFTAPLSVFTMYERGSVLLPMTLADILHPFSPSSFTLTACPD